MKVPWRIPSARESLCRRERTVGKNVICTNRVVATVDMLPSKRTVKKALNAEKGAFCMSRKNKISSELKKKVVRMCKSGQVSQAEAARRCGVSESTIKRWLSRERSEGCAGLESEATNRVYPSELKLQAVTAYLTGKYSQQEICEKFKIKSTRQLHAWLKVYNSGKASHERCREAAA